MKKFFKFASYTLLYVIITFASAFGVVLISSGSSSDGASTPPSESTIPAQLTQMLSRLTNSNGLDVYLNADIEAGNDKYSVTIDALVDLHEGFDKLSVDGSVTVNVNDEMFAIDIKYDNGTLFFDLFNGKFKIETNNIMESVSQLLEILDVELPSLGIDMSQINMDMIMSLLSDLTETKGDNSITIKLNIPMLGEIQLVCDFNYAISRVILPKTSISQDTVISLDSKFDYPDSVKLDMPEEEEYINISDLFLITESVLGLLDQEDLGMDFQLGYNDLKLNASLSANLKEFDSKVTLKNILGYDANLVAVDDIIYLEFGNINLCYDLNKSYLITNLLETQFGISVPLDEITQILVAINDGSLLEKIGSLIPTDSNGISLSEIDLSVIESFKHEGNTYTVSISDIGEISFVIEERKIKKLSFNGFGFDISADIVAPKEIGLTYDKEKYINLEDIIPALNALFSTVKYPTFSGSLSIEVGAEKYFADYTLSVNGEDSIVKLSAEMFNQTIEITATKDDIYLQLSDLKLKAKYTDIDKVVKFLQNNFQIGNSEDAINALLEQVKVFLNPNVYPSLISDICDKDNALVVTTYKGSQIKFGYSETINSISYCNENAKVELSINASKEIIEDIGINEEEYSPIDNLLSIMQNAIDYVNAGKFYLELKAELEDMLIIGAVNFDINSKELSLTCGITYGDLIVGIKFVDNKIYIELNENNLMFDLEDIDLVFDFIAENLGFDARAKIQELLEIMPLDEDLGQNESETSDDEIDNGMQANKVSIEDIISALSIKNIDGKLEISLLSANIELSFNNFKLNEIKASYDNISASIKVLNEETKINLDKEYTNISEVLGYVEILKNYLTSEQYYLSANADVYENGDVIYSTDDARIEFDMTEKIKLYASVKVSGRDSHSMEVYYHNDFLYANYNELLIKINSKDLGEIVVLLMQMFGIDPNLLPFLQDIAGNMDNFNIANLQLPEVSLGKITSILNMLKGIKIEDNTLSVKLNLFGQEGNISIMTDGNKLTAITLENIAVSNEQKFNLDINCLDFQGVQVPDESKNWVDISGSNELIKAMLNMAEMRDFQISGTLGLTAKVIGIPINMNVPFDVKVKIVDGKLEMMAQIGVIPTLIGEIVNEDAPSGYNGDDRMAYIYLKDDYVYIHRTESTNKHGSYEKKLKVHYTEFLSDPMAYLQYIVGLSDTIMKEIDKAMELSRNRTTPIDVSKIIKEFTVNSDANTYNIKLNLAELSNNPQLDYIGIGLKVINNDSTNNKNIIGGITFDMYAPVASAFTVTLKSDDITLDNIGEEIDMSAMHEYVNAYTYGENEQWIHKDGNDNLDKIKSYKITFVENGGNEVADITAEFGANITLPSFEDRKVDDIENRTRTTYKFVGWFEDEALSIPFTKTTMQRFGATLYAKWEVVKVEKLYALIFNTDGEYGVGNAMENVYLVANEIYNLPDATWTFNINRDADDNGYNWGKFAVDWTVRRYTFAGWFADSDLTTSIDSSITITADTVIYAKWNQTVKTEYWALGQKPNGK